MEASTTYKQAVSALEPYISTRELLRQLSSERGQTFTSETFRKWRRVAQVTSRGLYTEYEAARLMAVAKTLKYGKSLQCSNLQMTIRRILIKERTHRES